MIYNNLIMFWTYDATGYDSSTGDYVNADMHIVKSVFGAVMDTKTETVKLVYGNLSQESKTIIIQGHIDKPFNAISIGDTKKYKCDYRRKLKNKEVFIVHEMV